MGQGQYEKWDGHKVYTLSVQDVECVEFEHYPNSPADASNTFKLEPDKLSAIIDFQLSSHKQGLRIRLRKLR